VKLVYLKVLFIIDANIKIDFVEKLAAELT
jgi:hypothetical protein